MQRLLSTKFVLIGSVALIILVPLSMIGGLVQERQDYHRQAITEMAGGSTGAQRVIGPVLLLPCEESYPVEYYDPELRKNKQRRDTRDCTTYALPEVLKIVGSMGSDIRSRGIHDALFYTSALKVQARFIVPANFGSGGPDTRIKLGQASLSVGVSDIRGVMNVPVLTANGTEIPFAPGTKIAVLGSGMHTIIGAFSARQTVEATFTLKLRGLERFDFVPLGRETTVALNSKWRHPSFVGKYLPTTRQVSSNGFEAVWSTSHFATGLEQLFARHAADGSPCREIDDTSFGVTLIDPVDLYTQADRAQKYGFLFVLLTFVALLGTELARGLHLHPVQYTMVGVALAVFFLLLLSLAEHLGFLLAYLFAAVACVSLLGYYVRHIVRSTSIGGAFGATLCALYGLLYAVLTSEDYALLTGALFVFGVLAALMVLTRNVDWHTLSHPGIPKAAMVDSKAGGESA